MKVKVSKWDIHETFMDEEDIQVWVEVSIEEAQKDNDLKYLANCLEVAAEARKRLAAKNGISTNVVDAERFPDEDKNPLTAFDKAARSFGYRVVLAPV
jgi:DNA-binding phage protein